MDIKKWQHKLRQSMYKPQKSKFSLNNTIADLKEIDTLVEDTINEFLGTKKEKKDDAKKESGKE